MAVDALAEERTILSSKLFWHRQSLRTFAPPFQRRELLQGAMLKLHMFESQPSL